MQKHLVYEIRADIVEGLNYRDQPIDGLKDQHKVVHSLGFRFRFCKNSNVYIIDPWIHSVSQLAIQRPQRRYVVDREGYT